MSTSIDEINYLTRIAEKRGALVERKVDNLGMIEALSIYGLEGMRDITEGAPIAVMETLRKIVGKEAYKPQVSKDADGNTVYEFNAEQEQIYRAEYILANLVSSRKIPMNDKFIGVYPASKNSDEKTTIYCANIEGNVHKFDSKKAFDAHDPRIIKTKLTYYKFDISDPEQLQKYEDSVRELKYAGVKTSRSMYMPHNQQQKDYFAKLQTLNNEEIELNTKHVFGNQWNSEPNKASDIGLRVFDWQEIRYPNASIKEGYFLEQTDAMKDIRRSMDKGMEY